MIHTTEVFWFPLKTILLLKPDESSSQIVIHGHYSTNPKQHSMHFRSTNPYMMRILATKPKRHGQLEG
jgi:hypothetical protein